MYFKLFLLAKGLLHLFFLCVLSFVTPVMHIGNYSADRRSQDLSQQQYTLKVCVRQHQLKSIVPLSSAVVGPYGSRPTGHRKVVRNSGGS